MVTIYKYSTPNLVRANIDPDDTSQQSVSLMGEDTLTLNFTVATPITFRIGDYCFWFGKMYQVNILPQWILKANRNIAYTLVLESEMYDLGKVQFLFLNSVNVFTDSVFSFRGTPKDYGDLLIYNLKRVYPLANWVLGNVIEADFITQDFNSQNCLEALKTIAQIFQTEYLVEGKTIHIYQRQSSSGIVLQYGKDQALLSIEQQNQTNANIITRLYVYGSTRNIEKTYRNASTRLRIGNTNYLEKNINLYNVIERTVIFDGTTSDVKTNAPLPEIYPHRTGTITAVDPSGEGDFYFLNFYDADIDFDVNSYLLPAPVIAQVTFNTGLLAGYTFQINSFTNSTKKFVLVQDTSQPNLIVPTATLAPAVGDQYVITNIKMPDAYITDAEAALRAAGQAYLDSHSIPPISFVLTCNSKWFRQNNVQLVLAQSIEVKSGIMAVDRVIRITNFTRNIRNPYLFSMQLADTVTNSIIVKLINGL